jgi:NADH dehydrogenase
MLNTPIRVVLECSNHTSSGDKDSTVAPRARLKDVYALGDCATIKNMEFPATAQVASQKAEWLAKRLNKGDVNTQAFKYNNLGVMAYLGN